MDARDAGRVRLDLAQLVALDPTQARHAVRRRPPLELAQAVELRRVERDDELPALAQRQPTLGAVGAQELAAAPAETRLERSRRVVDACVDDAAVVTGLVERDVRSFSSTVTVASGRASAILRATARPMMPPPTTPTRIDTMLTACRQAIRVTFGRGLACHHGTAEGLA